MTAREWKPGDKALVEVEVTWTDESTVQCSIAADDGYFLPINALRPLPADEVKAAVLAAFVEYGDEAGSGIHSWRCAYPDRYGPCSCREEFAADVAARVAGGAPGRSEAEVKAEALREAADEIAELAEYYPEGVWPPFGELDHDIPKDRAAAHMARHVYRNAAPSWLRDRAALLAKEDDR